MPPFEHDPDASPQSNIVGNELDSARSAMIDELRDYRSDRETFSDDDIFDHCVAIYALDEALKNWDKIKHFII